MTSIPPPNPGYAKDALKWMRELQGDGAHVLASWAGCREDLRHSRQACDFIQAELAKAAPDTALTACLWTAAVINYTRPFQRDARQPLPDQLLEACSEGARAYHDVMMATRNKHLAHSENTMETVLPILELSDPETGQRVIKRVGVVHLRRQFQVRDVALLVALIEEVVWYLDQVLSQLVEDTEKQLREHPIDEIYAEPSLAELQVEVASGPREKRQKGRGGSDSVRL